MHSQRTFCGKRPLLPQRKYSTKYVKLQELNHTYSIPYFLTNTTAQPQNLLANASAAALLFCRQKKRSTAKAAPQVSEQKLWFTGAVFKRLQHTRIHISRISPEIVFQNSLNVSNIMQAKLQVIHQLFYISRLIERKHNILTKNSRLIKTRRPRL